MLCIVSEHTSHSGSRRATATRRENGKGIFLLPLVPALCCGLLLIVVVLATASALTMGVVVGVVVALVGIAVTLFVRHTMGANTASCGPSRESQASSPSRPEDQQR